MDRYGSRDLEGVLVARATWNGVVVAESDAYELVEGNVYFPPASVNRDLLTDSTHQTVCPWKGRASYYDLVVDGDVNEAAAWYYPEPKERDENIKNHVAFWKGVVVEA